MTGTLFSCSPSAGYFLLLWCTFFWAGTEVSLAQDLEMWVGDRQHWIVSHRHEDRAYYRLRDIAPIVGVDLQESGGLLTVDGSLGQLSLVDARPLVRLGDEYILLSNPVWRRNSSDWYVTEDFLVKALPLIIERKLDSLSIRRYRLETLDENRVVVRVANYSDHVRVVLESAQNTPVRVRDLDRYIEVRFENYLVQPEFPTDLPDRRFVASVEFDSSEIYGGFRIYKGTAYRDFREFTLSNPQRNVVDVFGSPAGNLADKAHPSDLEPPTNVDSPPEPRFVSPPEQSSPKPSFQNVITIDPGHGGEDYGSLSEKGDLEKNVALWIASRIQKKILTSGLQGILTRTRDVQLGIEQRSSVGNYYGSNVYVSLHVGGSPSVEIGGPVVFVHRYINDPDDENQEDKEASLDEELFPVVISGKTDEETESESQFLIPWNEGQKSHLSLSLELAEQLQAELNLLWGSDNQLVEVPLAVLAPIKAPAVLIETGFLTNPEDLEKLGSEEFKEQISGTITSVLLRFLARSQELDSNPESNLP